MSMVADELPHYAAWLSKGVMDLFDAQLVDQVAAAYDVKAAALAEIGGTLGRGPDRATEWAQRLREDRDKLGSAYQAMAGSTDQQWAVGNVLVGLSNLHIDTDSSVARSSCARDYLWALPQLTEMGAARLVQREYGRMRAVLEAEWLVWQSAEAASRAIEALYAVPAPGLDQRALAPTELPAMRQELEQAFALVDTPIAAGAQDDSVRAAEWLQLSTDGLEGGAPAVAPATEHARRDEVPAYPGQVVNEECTSETNIRIVQEQLRVHGYDVAVDGTYGRATLEAVRHYQTSQSLEPDGAVGPTTWSALFR
jgi:Putative peptidoglycan binding domain